MLPNILTEYASVPNNSDCGLSMRDDNLSSNSDPSYRLVGSSAPEGAGLGRLASSKTLETIRQMSCVGRKPVVGVSTMSDTNRAVQPQKMARCSEFRM